MRQSAGAVDSGKLHGIPDLSQGRQSLGRASTLASDTRNQQRDVFVSIVSGDVFKLRKVRRSDDCADTGMSAAPCHDMMRDGHIQRVQFLLVHFVDYHEILEILPSWVAGPIQHIHTLFPWKMGKKRLNGIASHIRGHRHSGRLPNVERLDRIILA
jgi:hypothetical protein